jgi:hypothetical protein
MQQREPERAEKRGSVHLAPSSTISGSNSNSGIRFGPLKNMSPSLSALADQLPPEVLIELCSDDTSVEVVERSLLRCCGNNRMSVCSLASENWDLDALSGVSGESTTMDVEESVPADNLNTASLGHHHSTSSSTDAMDVGLAIDEPAAEAMAG